MSEQKNESLYERQEKEFRANLKDETLIKNALEFCAHMNEAGWEHLGECVCFTVTFPGEGNFYLFTHGPSSCFCNSNLDNYPISDELRDFLWAHVNPCNHFKTNGKQCGCGQQPGLDFSILGRDFKNCCNCPICFMNPDAAKFEKIKELVPALKRCIEHVKKATVVSNPSPEGRIDGKRVKVLVAPPNAQPNEEVGNLFNGRSDTKYCACHGGEIIFKLDKPETLKMVGLVTADDNALYGGRIPKKLELYGAKGDGGDWVKLSTPYLEYAFNPITDYTEKAFKIANPAPFEYYKLTIEGNGVYQFSQMRLYV